MEAKDMMTNDHDNLFDSAEDDAAWIFDTYPEKDDDKSEVCRSTYIRRRLRMMATRHRYMVWLLKGERDGA